jgi:hypothetical protein
MNFQKFLIGFSMILTSAAAFAKPNGVTVDGYFINKISSINAINGMVAAKDPISDNAFIQVAGEPIPPGYPSDIFNVDPGTTGEVHYSIEVSSLTSYVTMRLLDQNSGQICYWIFQPNNPQPQADPNYPPNPPVCTLSGTYDFVMQTKTNK